MRLTAFRIYNFRSIVDTGWQKLSPDNITCLIGQNESGKTSVLEGLKVFHTGVITEDVLRSDMSLPRVACRFSTSGTDIQGMLDKADKKLKDKFRSLDYVTIERVWKADLSSALVVGGSIGDYLEELKEKKEKAINKTREKVMATGHDIEVARNLVKKSQEEINRLKDEYPEELKKGSGIKLFRKKNGEEDLERKKMIRDFESRLKESEQVLADNNKILTSNSDLLRELDRLNELETGLDSLQIRMDEIENRLEERHQTMTLLSGSSLNELSGGEWTRVLNDYKSVSSERESVEENIDMQVLLCGDLLNGNKKEQALQASMSAIAEYDPGYNGEEIGEILFGATPSFEIFEDFGSLLPNRIDLEDIISENDNVEGYKAARNFLTIARLDYNFFQQPSSRILKQKIENLNSKLTLDFQDFWQQFVGRNNKIRISFELDHYSIDRGDKAGKPYLEFWVKDEGERLYPKQRSRGVRWFLSFYLELMAASVREKENSVLLVDEPGVSLHARAQEDVLKVFEDIKKNIQVIYTTHSPHLVDIDKLHRVLAIQRDDVESQKSATTILDPVAMVDASPDTLSPLQSIMGNPVGNQEFSADKFNIIVNDVGTFYLMTAIMKITSYKGSIHFIPSTEPSSMPLMCNILMGWGMKFAVLLFNNEQEAEVADQLKNLAFTDDVNHKDLIVMMPEGFSNAEDLISTLDFKKHILGSREGITIPNSEYVNEKKLPRNFLLSKFLSNVKSQKIGKKDLDEETRENLQLILNIVSKYN